MEIESPPSQKEGSQKSLPIAQHRDPAAFLSRMDNYQKSKKAKIDEKRHNQEMEVEKELQSCSFKPKINANLGEKRTLEDLERWGQIQKDKLKVRKEQQEDGERSKVIRKGPKVSRSQTHVEKRFVEFDSNQVVNQETNHNVVENRLGDLGSTYKSNQRVKALVYGVPPSTDPKSTIHSKDFRTKTPEVNRTRRLEATLTAKQAKVDSVQAERNKLKQIINKTAHGEREDEVDFVSMNVKDPQVSTGSAIKRKPVGLETVKNLKQKVRAEILS